MTSIAELRSRHAGTVTIYSTSWCRWCDRAKELLESHGVTYRDVDIETWPEPRETLESLTGRRSVPQVFIGETHVGGFDDLATLEAQGELRDLYASERVRYAPERRAEIT